MALHSAVAIACSVIVFPESVNAQYSKILKSVFLPLCKTFERQSLLLSQEIEAIDDAVRSFSESIAQAEAALNPLAAARRLMKRDISWGRFGPDDFKKFHHIARTLAVRSDKLTALWDNGTE